MGLNLSDFIAWFVPEEIVVVLCILDVVIGLEDSFQNLDKSLCPIFI